ncbi:MAG: helix-turn-helix domain-containing protein [Chloroflexi bacterium]|nr:helix-turn-helix domain-containing protein [Chloroflexota bacterium]
MLNEPDKWLTLSQASKLLGVHSTTLRDWANQGLIESFQTPGGHRRFSEKDVKSFVELRKKGKGRRGLSVLMDRAIAHTQNELQLSAGSQPWMTAFSPEARGRQRELGRRLLGVMIQYLARENQSGPLLQEAREIGRQYGRECYAAGLLLPDTVRAFFFFRDSVTEVAVWLPQSAGTSRHDELHFFKQVNEFFNFVHLAIVEAYSETSGGR